MLLISASSFAQDRAGNLFIYWGYNRSSYTKSDLHFESPEYNFTIENARASDRPTPFKADVYFGLKTLSIPQYVYRVGYYISDRWSLSLGMDHLKYVFDNHQTAAINGEILTGKYSGTYNGESMMIPVDFLQFEHSDGLNYLSVEADRYLTIPVLKNNEKMRWEAIVGGGIGTYIPKTMVNLFGNVVDNRFHIAGYGANLNVKTRFYFIPQLFLTAGLKTGWAFLPNVLVDGSSQAKVNHNFGWGEFYMVLGGEFPLSKKTKTK